MSIEGPPSEYRDNAPSNQQPEASKPIPDGATDAIDQTRAANQSQSTELDLMVALASIPRADGFSSPSRRAEITRYLDGKAHFSKRGISHLALHRILHLDS